MCDVQMDLLRVLSISALGEQGSSEAEQVERCVDCHLRGGSSDGGAGGSAGGKLEADIDIPIGLGSA